MDALQSWRAHWAAQEEQHIDRPGTAPARLRGVVSASQPPTLPTISVQTLQRFHKLQLAYTGLASPVPEPQNASKSATVFGLLKHRQRTFPDVRYVPCLCGYKWCKARVSKKIASRYRRSCESLHMMFEAKKSMDSTYWETKRLRAKIKELVNSCKEAQQERDSRTKDMIHAQNEVPTYPRLFIYILYFIRSIQTELVFLFPVH